MKIYHCGNCNYPVYFENVVCSNCGFWLGYDSQQDQMVALSPGRSSWQPYGDTTTLTFIYCGNHTHQACNWLIPQDDATGLCVACDLNRTVPNLSDAVQLREWQELEAAKHRLVYALLRLGLPVQDKMTYPEHGLAFDFLADQPGADRVMTGHDEGLITLNVEEADSAQREANRLQLHEKYRTLVGHFRHEVGHYYWDELVASHPTLLADFRQLFGDERADYGQALQKHYKEGAPADWESRFISTYATSHPWEDWAETWAHYLHLLDLLESAYAFGLQVDPPGMPELTMQARADFDPYADRNMDRILSTAVPITFAVNSINRGMGRPDLYPFVLNGPVREKLSFINRVVSSAPALLAS